MQGQERSQESDSGSPRVHIISCISLQISSKGEEGETRGEFPNPTQEKDILKSVAEGTAVLRGPRGNRQWAYFSGESVSLVCTHSFMQQMFTKHLLLQAMGNPRVKKAKSLLLESSHSRGGNGQEILYYISQVISVNDKCHGGNKSG